MNYFYKEAAQIESWLEKHKITQYILIPDEKYGFHVNVAKDVYLNEKSLSFIPVKFGEIKGCFNCEKNNLTSLEFCPTKVHGYFNCSDNKITSLEGCPEYSVKTFDCSFNKLTSLRHAPKIILGDFFCAENRLTSLQYCPNNIMGNFSCGGNQIENLKYCPEKVTGKFITTNNKNLQGFEGSIKFEDAYNEHLRIIRTEYAQNLEAQLDFKSQDSIKMKL